MSTANPYSIMISHLYLITKVITTDLEWRDGDKMQLASKLRRLSNKWVKSLNLSFSEPECDGMNTNVVQY